MTPLKWLLCLAALLISQQALAQQAPCGQRKEIVAALAEKYREQPIAAGLTSAGSVLEIFASEGGNTFTVLLSQPDGMSCIMSAGQAWQAVKSELKPGQGT